jgi:hypothetical protein
VQVVRKEIYLLVEASINLQFPRAWQANHLWTEGSLLLLKDSEGTLSQVYKIIFNLNWTVLPSSSQFRKALNLYTNLRIKLPKYRLKYPNSSRQDLHFLSKPLLRETDLLPINLNSNSRLNLWISWTKL